MDMQEGKMSVVLEVSANLETMEAKKKGLEKSIMFLMSEWKGFEEHLDLTKKSFQEWFSGLQSREKRLNSAQESVNQSVQELESARKSVEQRFQEVGDKEKEFSLFYHKGVEDLGRKREDYVAEVAFNEEKLSKQENKLKGILEELKCRKSEIEGIKKLVEKEKGLKDKSFEGRRKEIVLIRDSTDRRTEELDCKEREIQERERKVEVKEKELYYMREESESEIEVKGKELDLMTEDLELKEKDMKLMQEFNEKRAKELDMKEKQLESIKKFTQERFKEFHLKKKECQLGKELVEKESKDLELKKKELEDKIKHFELREKNFGLEKKQFNNLLHAPVKSGAVENGVDESLTRNMPFADKFLVLIEDGKDLQIFLNEHEEDLDTIGEKVFKALQLFKDPAKVVLNAMEGFYPPHMKKGDVEFKGSVVRRSCILLLEQLVRISPKIQSCVRDEALKLASEWKTKMAVRDSLEVLGFLFLLASFDLASAFDSKELMSFLEVIVQQHQTPELCRHLGLQDQVPGLIESLLESEQSLEAIRYIYAFELVDNFQPVPILKNYLELVKKSANSMSKRWNTQSAKNEAIDKKVAAMRAVIRCIVDNKLELQYSPKILEGSIKQFLELKGENKLAGTDSCDKAQGKGKVEEKQSSSSTVSIPVKTHNLAPDLSKTFVGPSHPMAVILANMDGKNLLAFLSSHVPEHELLHDEVFTALQISNHSAKLVLDAIEGLCHSHPTKEEAASSVFLFEQLIKMSPHIMPDVKEAAQKIATCWQARIKAEIESPLLFLRFLQLISIYKLAPAFDRDELLSLYQRVVKHKHVPGLCQALGISEEISDSSMLHSQVKSHQTTLKTSVPNNLAASSCTVPVLDVKPLHHRVNQEGEECAAICSEVPNFIQKSSDPAKLVLDALQNCHGSNFEEDKNPPFVVESFFCLLEQLMSASPDIKLNVKERALDFARDWKARSIGPLTWEAIGFLQLVATYKLSTFFNANDLLGFLEVAHQPKKASNLIKILGLVDKVPDFILGLIKKKQLLVAFTYVYEFKLLDKFPPVALLKKHVLHSELVAKKICNEGKNTPETQDKAMVSKISALKAVIKCVIHHGLQSQYPPDELRARIEKLESQRANLKASIQEPVLKEKLHEVDTGEEVSVVLEAQYQAEDKKKRPARDAAFTYEGKSKSTKRCRWKGLPEEAVLNDQFANDRPIEFVKPLSQLANDQPLHIVPTFSQLPSGFHVQEYEPSFRVPVRYYSLGGSAPVMQHMHQFASHYGSNTAGNRESTHFGFSSHRVGMASNYLPLSTPPELSFYPPWHTSGYPTLGK